MPVRRIPKNYRNVTGMAAHRKAEGCAAFESTLERDFLVLLEFSPEVDRFEVQPVTIEWLNGQGKPRKYTPDVLVSYASGTSPTLFEVKYRSDLKKDWAVLRPKFKVAIRYAKAQGWRFRIATEVEIRTPYLANAHFLLPFLRRNSSLPSDDALLKSALSSLPEATPEILLNHITDNEQERVRLLPILWRMISLHEIGADLDQRLSMNSPLWSKQ